MNPALPHNKTIRRIMYESFMGGTAWGIGTVIGASVVLAVIGFLITQARTIPFVGDIIYIILQEVEKYRLK